MHECMLCKAYCEAQDIRGMSAMRGPEWNGDRELGMRSISSLLMRESEIANERCEASRVCL